MPTSPPGSDAQAVAPTGLREVLRSIAPPLVLLGAMWAGSGLVPTPPSDMWVRIALYGSVGVFFLLASWMIAGLVPLGHYRGSRLALAAIVLFALVMAGNLLELPGITDACKICFGAIVGIAIARHVERPWWMLPICVLVPLADAWSVYSSRGVTHAVVERSREDPTWITWPTVAVPIAGYDYDAAPRIGIVDFLFVAVFLTIAWNFHLGLRRGTLLLPLAFVVTNLLIFEGIVVEKVPALPALCVMFLILFGRVLVLDARAAWRERAAIRLEDTPPPDAR